MGQEGLRFQSMELGVHGLHGAHATTIVEIQEIEHVTIQLLYLEEVTVQGLLLIHHMVCAMGANAVQTLQTT